ncbi:hypothetical protein E3E14_14090 [Streptomyces sp. ICN441]|uniref:hypothetical protein n=1 Tax=Streptomyces sp. ICN441 TaxID=2558286 RepID=UPI00106AB5ED|nr:hypothetical protein [Streptomyces sp. ICN441]TFE50455.1 hypothetical protein E3E14_14090 [Streptomyces sp. ICN441]
MTGRVKDHSYGRSGIRIFAAVTDGPGTELTREISATVRLSGGLGAVFESGDNSDLLPTSSMDVAVSTLFQEFMDASLEAFAEALVRHFASSCPASLCCEVNLAENRWGQLAVGSKALPHLFGTSPSAALVAHARSNGAGNPVVWGGRRGLEFCKTTGTSFGGFLRDRFTEAMESPDRLVRGQLEVLWEYGDVAGSTYEKTGDQVFECVTEALAASSANSVQNLLYRTGAAVLDDCPAIGNVRLAYRSPDVTVTDPTRFGSTPRGRVLSVSPSPAHDLAVLVQREG